MSFCFELLRCNVCKPVRYLNRWDWRILACVCMFIHEPFEYISARFTRRADHFPLIRSFYSKVIYTRSQNQNRNHEDRLAKTMVIPICLHEHKRPHVCEIVTEFSSEGCSLLGQAINCKRRVLRCWIKAETQAIRPPNHPSTLRLGVPPREANEIETATYLPRRADFWGGSLNN